MRISDWSSDVCSSDLSRPSRRSRRRSRCAPPVGGAVPRRSPRTRTPWLVAPSGDARQQCLEARIVVQRVEVAVVFHPCTVAQAHLRSEEHTSELQSLMRTSSAVFCLKKTKKTKNESSKIH